MVDNDYETGRMQVVARPWLQSGSGSHANMEEKGTAGARHLISSKRQAGSEWPRARVVRTAVEGEMGEDCVQIVHSGL